MNQLTVLEKMNPVEIFSANNLDTILSSISTEVRALHLDMSTSKGRQQIASVAFKIARSKTFLDDLGKKLGEDAQAKLNAINADRRKAREFLDSLKEEVRKPLTEWEEAEKRRVAEHETHLKAMELAGKQVHENWQAFTPEQILARKFEIEENERDWEEFTARATTAATTSIAQLNEAHTKVTKHLAEQAELVRLRAEAQERAQKEREEKIARDAAENARLQAEAAAKAEADRVARAAEVERQRILKAQADAEAAAKRAKEQAEEASASAEREKAAAVEAEKQRAERAQRELELEERARQKDKEHRHRIMSDILGAMVDRDFDEEASRKFINAMVLGRIPHVKVVF